MEIVSRGSEENAHIVVFRGWTKMDPDENAHIVANPSAAGTDWEDFWCGRECLYSSKSGAVGTNWEWRAPQAHHGAGRVPLMPRQKLLQGHCNEAEPRFKIFHLNLKKLKNRC